MNVRITDVDASDESLVEAIAAMLVDGFRQNAPDLATAIVLKCANHSRLIASAASRSTTGAVGWIGGIKHYSGHTWELHPLVVKIDQQRRGIGRALVRDLEQRVVALGGSTIYLGTDDEQNQTSIAGIDLYPDVWQHVRSIRNFRDHPYEFYQKLGFDIVGVIPDANGFGKPDILMAKRVGRSGG